MANTSGNVPPEQIELDAGGSQQDVWEPKAFRRWASRVRTEYQKVTKLRNKRKEAEAVVSRNFIVLLIQ